MSSDPQRKTEVQQRWISTARRALKRHYRSMAVEIANKHYDKGRGNSPEPLFGSQQIVKDVKSGMPTQSPLSLDNNATVTKISNKVESALSSGNEKVAKLQNSKPVQKCTDIIRQLKVIIEPVGLFLVAIFYACVGGGIYYALEHQNERDEFVNTKRLIDSQMKAAANDISDHCANATRSDLIYNKTATLEHVESVIGNLVSLLGAYPISGNFNHWNYAGCVWFSITIFTTIGYGNYAPKTIGGRVFTIIYAIIGIPMMLLVLSETGKMFAWILKSLYNCFAGICLEIPKRKLLASKQSNLQDARKDISRLETNATDMIVDPVSSSAMETPDTTAYYTSEQLESFDFPIVFSVFLLVAWILIVSAVSYSRGLFNNSYFNSIYYWMITLTTIGLGDFTPNDPVIAILCFPVFVTGLALLSMIITMIQVRMEEMEELILDDYLGFDEDDKEENDNVKQDGDHFPEFHRDPGMTLGIFQAASPTSDKNNELNNVLDAWKKKQPLFGVQPKQTNKIKVPKDVAKLIKTLGGPGNVRVKKINQSTQTD